MAASLAPSPEAELTLEMPDCYSGSLFLGLLSMQTYPRAFNADE